MQDDDVPAAYYQWDSLKLHMPTTTVAFTTKHVKEVLRGVRKDLRFSISSMTSNCGTCNLIEVPSRPLRRSPPPTCRKAPDSKKDIPNQFRHARYVLDAQRSPTDILPKTLGELQLLYAENLLDDIAETLEIEGCPQLGKKCFPRWLQNSLFDVLRKVDEHWCKISSEIMNTARFKAKFPDVVVPPTMEKRAVGSCLPAWLS